MMRGCHSIRLRTYRKSERGQTILLVAVSMVALFAMAALAIDVSNLYIARTEAEKAAAAGALAGARAFVTSGFTSGGLGVPSSASAQSLVCNNSTGFADVQAKNAANQNFIAGKLPSSVTTTCAFPSPQNPRVSVTVQASAPYTFFSRIWGRSSGQLSAVSTAEAYNPSGQTVPIQVASVKPWLIPNCDYGNNTPGLTNLNCPALVPGGPFANYYLNPADNYAVANNGSFIGRQVQLQQLLPSLLPIMPSLLNTYLALDLDIDAASASCPALSSPSCGGLNPSVPSYPETIACANAVTVACGDNVTIDPGGGILLSPSAVDAPKCLIHSADNGLDQGQDKFHFTGLGEPISIEGGSNNPDATLQGKTNISRSDSVVTVPIWDGGGPLLGPGGLQQEKVIGFMQLGIEEVQPGLINLTSEIRGRILNVSGCGNAGGTPVSGAKTSPIPVRLVQ
jgi:hypothetical protein